MSWPSRSGFSSSCSPITFRWWSVTRPSGLTALCMRRPSGSPRGPNRGPGGVVIGTERPRVGWVLGGGGARGAYEIGVCDYIFEHVARDLGGPVPLDILCGTSVGALHVFALAAGAADPRAAARALVERRGNGEFRRGARLPERSISANDAMRLAA